MEYEFIASKLNNEDRRAAQIYNGMYRYIDYNLHISSNITQVEANLHEITILLCRMKILTPVQAKLIISSSKHQWRMQKWGGRVGRGEGGNGDVGKVGVSTDLGPSRQ